MNGIVDSVTKYSAIKRSYLGIRYVSVTPEVAEKAKTPKISGVLVTGDSSGPAVAPGSPAEKAGIKDGDFITEIDGKALSSAFGVKEALSEKFPGEKVVFKIYRKSALGNFEPKSVEAELSDR
ncbi:MAG: PDZ domain-containing protein [Patescibacteria group bacterium]